MDLQLGRAWWYTYNLAHFGGLHRTELSVEKKRAQWPHGAEKTNLVMRNFKIQDFGKKAAAETETKRYFGVP